MKIKTEIIYPPIPNMRWEWIAVDDNYDGPTSPIGRGATEQEAIEDLLDKFEWRKEYGRISKS